MPRTANRIKSKATKPSPPRPGVTNPDKVMYPEPGFTKGQVIDYYQRIAPVLLPHLKDRALTLKRYPNGVDQKFFYEKNCPSHRPDFINTITVPAKEGKIDYCTIAKEKDLIWVANLASLELHTSLAKSADMTRPTMMVFDFDPGLPATIIQCCQIALRLRSMLQHLKLECFAKTSGGKGLHVYIPLNTPRVTFDETKRISETFARLLEKDDPQHVTATMAKSLREGRVFIDWSQNDRHKTTVSVYSLRARAHPTCSTPVTWEEVEAASKARKGSPLVFETKDVLKRVEKHGDLFAPMLKLKQKLPAI
jgi:bifunctional non-homologous end joining protein LigD